MVTEYSSVSLESFPCFGPFFHEPISPGKQLEEPHHPKVALDIRLYAVIATELREGNSFAPSLGLEDVCRVRRAGEATDVPHVVHAYFTVLVGGEVIQRMAGVHSGSPVESPRAATEVRVLTADRHVGVGERWLGVQTLWVSVSYA